MAPDAVHHTPAGHTAKTAEHEANGLVLPVQIFLHGDLSRLSRELEAVESFFAEAAIRSQAIHAVPQASILLNTLVAANGLNLLKAEDRKVLTKFLAELVRKSPIVHMSFATDPKPEFLSKLVSWFRREAHPYTMLHVGLQPNIAAGCVLRTTNKYFDLSFKEHFNESKQKLVEALRSKV